MTPYPRVKILKFTYVAAVALRKLLKKAYEEINAQHSAIQNHLIRENRLISEYTQLRKNLLTEINLEAELQVGSNLPEQRSQVEKAIQSIGEEGLLQILFRLIKDRLAGQ